METLEHILLLQLPRIEFIENLTEHKSIEDYSIFYRVADIKD